MALSATCAAGGLRFARCSSRPAVQPADCQRQESSRRPRPCLVLLLSCLVLGASSVFQVDLLSIFLPEKSFFLLDGCSELGGSSICTVALIDRDWQQGIGLVVPPSWAAVAAGALCLYLPAQFLISYCSLCTRNALWLRALRWRILSRACLSDSVKLCGDVFLAGPRPPLLPPARRITNKRTTSPVSSIIDLLLPPRPESVLFCPVLSCPVLVSISSRHRVWLPLWFSNY